MILIEESLNRGKKRSYLIAKVGCIFDSFCPTLEHASCNEREHCEGYVSPNRHSALPVANVSDLITSLTRSPALLTTIEGLERFLLSHRHTPI